jgi:DNA-binding MarR family transcriptional regulator
MSREVKPSTRERLCGELLDELLSHSPAAVMRVMRKRPGGAISLVHLNVLSVLEHDGPQAMRGLAEALDVSQASATGIVDRMAERGLVTRQRGTADRRVIRVALTAEGGAVLGGLSAERREAVGELLDELTDTEIEGFLLGARAMRRARERRHASGADCRSVGQGQTS